jgi:DNA (cytosine-5)-methyltransferase 1
VRFGSLFSGVGGFDLGFERAGMACAWQCEIDAKARAVLALHWPNVPQHTDVREIGAANLGAVDLVCGGFPCQDLSVAGKRAGLAGERSGLWFEFRRILAELQPGWVVVENVPGLLSSNGGADVAVVVRGLVELGYGVCWRVLDAQYFGVAQRRRRVFIVGHLGDGRAAQVLFEPESLCGDTPPRREAGEGPAGTLGGGALDGASQGVTQPFTFQSRIARNGRGQPDDVVPALRGAEEGDTADSKPLVAQPLQPAWYNTKYASKDEADARTLLRALREALGEEAFAQWGLGVLDTLQSSQVLRSRLHGASLRCEAYQLNGLEHGALPCPEACSSGAMCHMWQPERDRCSSHRPQSFEQLCRELSAHLPKLPSQTALIKSFLHGLWRASEGSRVLQQALSAVSPMGESATHQDQPAHAGFAVRRLTPTETERLQGFPDGWTAGWHRNRMGKKVKPWTDSARYRQMGNAVCVPVAEWIGRRIMEAL